MHAVCVPCVHALGVLFVHVWIVYLRGCVDISGFIEEEEAEA